MTQQTPSPPWRTRRIENAHRITPFNKTPFSPNKRRKSLGEKLSLSPGGCSTPPESRYLPSFHSGKSATKSHKTKSFTTCSSSKSKGSLKSTHRKKVTFALLPPVAKADGSYNARTKRQPPFAREPKQFTSKPSLWSVGRKSTGSDHKRQLAAVRAEENESMQAAIDSYKRSQQTYSKRKTAYSCYGAAPTVRSSQQRCSDASFMNLQESDTLLPSTSPTVTPAVVDDRFNKWLKLPKIGECKKVSKCAGDNDDHRDDLAPTVLAAPCSDDFAFLLHKKF